MRETSKYVLIYCAVVASLVFLAVDLAKAQESVVQDVTVVSEDDSNNDDGPLASARNFNEPAEPLDQAELDQMLAPIALYPDALLSHILVAATYPLELVQADRWREDHASLDEQDALDAVEDKDWDPSVKALVPFADLLSKLTEDLNWLQRLGDAFLANEDQVLDSVQALRRLAYERGTLEDNDYIEVVEEEQDIVIQPVEKEIVYVPYYDTRYVYGDWRWASHPPMFWHRPAHYYWHAGFYWSPRVYIRPSYFWGGFHWRKRHLVVHHHYYNHPRRYRFHRDHEPVRVREFQRWRHNPEHRRGARYRHGGVKSVYRHNKMRPVVVKNDARAVHHERRTAHAVKHANEQVRGTRDAKFVKQRLNREGARETYRSGEKPLRHQPSRHRNAHGDQHTGRVSENRQTSRQAAVDRSLKERRVDKVNRQQVRELSDRRSVVRSEARDYTRKDSRAEVRSVNRYRQEASTSRSAPRQVHRNSASGGSRNVVRSNPQNAPRSYQHKPPRNVQSSAPRSAPRGNTTSRGKER